MKKRIHLCLLILILSFVCLTACTSDISEQSFSSGEKSEDSTTKENEYVEESTETTTEINVQAKKRPNKDNFESPNYDDYKNYKPGDFDTPYIYLEGTITKLWEFGFLISDSDGNMWEICITSSSMRDFSEYLNTTCEVYGKVDHLSIEGSVSPIYNIPSVALFYDETCCVVFNDEKIFHDYYGAVNDEFNPLPEDKVWENNNKSSQTEQNSSQTEQNTSQNGNNNGTSSVTVPEAEQGTNLVWVPVNGGTKYHSKKGCSNMEDPIQVTKETAEANGYTPCGRCH